MKRTKNKRREKKIRGNRIFSSERKKERERKNKIQIQIIISKALLKILYVIFFKASIFYISVIICRFSISC